ncbi:putative Holliday junction resolvase [Hydrogenispora ethanolica]|uniref:Putative pre-16S rRNA nuclease n=1 Tax=Hydrogenispora ethanolica TaxID=1082276 RepID=A0A4R1RTG8_HYDET|nr:Holliday junction resolvase RuvX [Hydrogenispora ethanolica]TCL69360.1 putative Holliday junction resolvase [Hydrogenispora ethanolica]
MRWMGLDVGEKRIGIAISDPLEITAQGYMVLQRSGSFRKDLDSLCQMMSDREIDGLVIGLPKNMNGTEGPMAEKVRGFGTELAKLVKIPIFYWDERLSTGSAEKALLEADLSRRERRSRIDKVAAVIILQNFLDAKVGMNLEQKGKIPE